jgi:membrane protein required for colicin V production
MNPADYVLLSVVLISSVVGLVRGLLREVIAILTWFFALWLGWSLADLVEPYLGGLLAQESVRTWSARALIIIIVLLIGAAAGAIVGYFVRLSIFSGADRFFGFLFGLLRGILLIGVLALLGQLLRLDEERWWRGSRLIPHAESVANAIRSIVGEPHAERAREALLARRSE